jgi:hypothetical protein
MGQDCPNCPFGFGLAAGSDVRWFRPFVFPPRPEVVTKDMPGRKENQRTRPLGHD